MKLCPICDTENKPQASHCDVCGERLTPPAPGEEVSPEESVLSMLAADPPAAPAEPPPSASPPAATPPPRPKPEIDEAAWAELEAAAAAEDVSEQEAGKPSPLPAASDPDPVTGPPAPAAATPVAPTTTPAAPQAKPRPKPKVEAPRIVSSGIPDARLVVYVDKQPTHTHPIVNDETLIGRYDPISNSDPDLDVTEFDPDCATSRKHAYIYRQSHKFYIYPVSNAGTQLNNELVDMGAKKRIKDGDVIILAARLAMKFHVDEADED